MATLLHSLIIFAALLGHPPTSQAEEGKLPQRGSSVRTTSPSPQSSAIASTPRPSQAPAQHSLCDSYLATSVLGEAFYSKPEKALYLLARKTKAARAAPATGAGEDYGVNLLRVSFAQELPTARSIMAISLRGQAALIPHGNPIEGFSILSWSTPNSCYEGPAEGIAIPLKPMKDQKLAQSFPPGIYKLIPTQTGRTVADLKSGYFRELDFHTLQRRQGPAFPKNEQPFYYDDTHNQIFTWTNAAAGQVNRYLVGNTARPKAKMHLAANMKILNDREKLAAVSFDNKANIVTIHELAKWGATESKSYSIKLPAQYPVGKSTLEINLDNKLIMVTGNRQQLQEWDSAFVYNYKDNILVAKLQLPPKLYIAQIAWLQTMNDGVAIVWDENDSLQSLYQFQSKSGAWRQIDLKLAL